MNLNTRSRIGGCREIRPVSPEKISDTLNEIIEMNQRMAQELEHVSTVVGKEGKIDQRASCDIEDDRSSIETGDRVLLVIEDDLNFAQILLDMARSQGFKGIAASRSDVGLLLAQEFNPAALEALKTGHFDCIVLDMGLPDISGLELLEQIRREAPTAY